MEEFAQRAGIKLTHVPFKGNADNMQAVLGEHVMAASDATGWGPHVEAGKLRLLATYGSKRTKRWPTVPTLDELGYTGWVGCEYRPKADTVEGLGWRQEFGL